jgi:hypothetical protein
MLRAAVFAAALITGADLGAQDTLPPRPPQGTLPVDSASRDSAARLAALPDSIPRDSIKPGFAQSERPGLAEIRGGQYRWDRERLYVAGAHNLAELLAEVPGVGLQRSSYLLSPIVPSYFGELGRVRVFFDGVEIDPLDARTGGQLDLASIPLYGLESVTAERTAGELRVHLRSWQVLHTTPYTRVDVGTGSEAYTLYRGFYGKRFQNGLGFQLVAQQFATTNGITRGDGDSFGGMARVGWANGHWSVDALGLSNARRRTATRRYVRSTPDDAALARFEGAERNGYVRVGYRNPDSSGVWLQAIAATQIYVEDDSLSSSAATPDLDTLRSQAQYVLTGGVTLGQLRLSGVGRYRVRGGNGFLAPSARAAWYYGRASLTAAVELEGPDSSTRADVSTRIALLSWLHVAGTATQRSGDFAAADLTALRAELGLTIAERWLTVGVIQRSESQVQGMPIFDAAYVPTLLPASQGLFASLGGQIWGPMWLDFHGVTWADEQFYRPKVESRTALRVSTGFRKYIPRNTFHLQASFIHDYRSDLLAPDPLGAITKAKGNSALSLLVDIRLGSAHLFFHNRNFTGEVYETVPGYLMPRLVQQYGLRWEFWN